MRVALWAAYRLVRVYWFVFRPREEGAHVAVWHAGRILLIRNSYRSRRSLPAGNLRRGETPRAAAVRELREEVGIEVAPERLRFARTVVDTSDYKEDHSHFFELETSEPPLPRPDGREVVWAGFVTLEDALADALSPPVRVFLEAVARRQSRSRS